MATGTPPAGYTPSQIRHAYGFDRVPYDGSGQTIAIVDAYDHPSIDSNLATFDQTFGIPAPPSFRKVDQYGFTHYPNPDPGWACEIALDVEWAHAIAPGANILLVEAYSAGLSDFLTAVNYARSQPGVVVVSMSWGMGEFSSETIFDPTFTTPAGHIGGSGLPGGVTFVASSGDSGALNGPSWPAISSHVLAVGGTSLTLDSQGNYGSETGWSYSSADPVHASGGGYSQYLTEPSYQTGVQSTGRRSNPDVAYDGDPQTPFRIYTTVGGNGWLGLAGTSAGAPQWAALFALVDQEAAQVGLGSFDGSSYILPRLYNVGPTSIHDILIGYNGYYAGPGYDLVTGIGTPHADSLIGSNAHGAVSVDASFSGNTTTLLQSRLNFPSAFEVLEILPTVTYRLAVGLWSDVTSITINSFQYGNHSINVENTSANVPVTINLRFGTDTVNISPGAMKLDNIQGAVTIYGGGGNDALTVNDQATTSGRTYILNGGSLSRTPVAAINYSGVGTVVVNGGGGGNTINVQSTASGTTTTVNAGAGGATVNVGDPLHRLQTLGPLTVHGQGGSNTLNVNDQGSTPSLAYTLTASTVTQTYIPGITYGGIQALVLNAGSGGNAINVLSTPAGTATTVNGGAGDDTFTVGAPGLYNGGPLTVNGQGGSNTLVVDDRANATAQTYTVTSTSVSRTGGPVGAIGYADIQRLVLDVGSANETAQILSTPAGTAVTITGGSGNNTLVGSDANNVWAVTGHNAGTLDGPAYASPVAFSDFNNLAGGAGDDTFRFVDSMVETVDGDHVSVTYSSGSVDGTIDGGGGTNTLDYSGHLGFWYIGVSNAVVGVTLADVVVNLQTSSATDVRGGFARIQNFMGSEGSVGASNRLVGPNAAATWLINGVNAGSLSSPGLAAPVTFTAFPNLVGGAGANTFQFTDGAALAGSITGSGADALDYTAYSTSVVVDLQTGRATGVGASVSGIAGVLGGNGNGALGAYNLLIGGGGNSLQGGTGRRNLLIAGPGASALYGGDDEDILIGGTTAYDTDLSSLLAIMAEWARTDEDYFTRVFNLTHGVGVPLLDATTVTGNGGGNTMTGYGGLALLYGDSADVIFGFDPGSQLIPITP
jgi:hypothetical protein